MCIIYDGQEEIVYAVKKIIRKGIPPDKISKETIKQNLYTHNIPEADYIIRTGMEDGARISGFLLWDSSYAEFRFRKELWPDYNEEMLLEDLKEYVRRNRRKGA
ncbi:Decaprenyl diphosphate synthase [subsurface metagenome]